MSLLWFADAHLDLAIWASRPDLVYDSRWAFSHLVGEAIRRKVEAVLAAGDLINIKRPPSAVVTFIRKQMDRLAKAKIPLYFIQGQHERADPPWFSTVHSWPKHLNGAAVSLDGRVIAGADWTPAVRLMDVMSALPPADTLMCHQVWEEFMGGITSPEGSISDLPEQFTTVVTGDYHKMVMKRMGARLVLSPGPTNMRKINESGACCYAVSTGPKFVWGKIPSRPVLRVDFRTAQEAPTADAIIAQLQAQIAKSVVEAESLPAELRKPIVYVVSAPRDSELVAAIENSRVAYDSFLFTSVKSKDAPSDGLAQTTSTLAVPRLTDILHEAVPKSSPLYNLALSLLNSGSPAETLESIKQERGLCG